MDWLETFLRVLVLIGLFVGAYRGYRKMRASGTWSGTATGVTLLLLLVYIAGAVTIVTA